MKNLISVTHDDDQEFEFDWILKSEWNLNDVIMRKISKYLTIYNINQFGSNDITNAILLRYTKEHIESM